MLPKYVGDLQNFLLPFYFYPLKKPIRKIFLSILSEDLDTIRKIEFSFKSKSRREDLDKTEDKRIKFYFPSFKNLRW